MIVQADQRIGCFRFLFNSKCTFFRYHCLDNVYATRIKIIIKSIFTQRGRATLACSKGPTVNIRFIAINHSVYSRRGGRLTVHNPSYSTTSWYCLACLAHHFWVAGLKKSGYAVIPGQTLPIRGSSLSAFRMKTPSFTPSSNTGYPVWFLIPGSWKK